MERTGEIKSVQGEWLEIEFCRPKDCEKCNACHGGQKVMSLRLKGKGQVGDKAVVSLPDHAVTKASFIVYLIPVLGLFAGMLLGDKLAGAESSLGSAIGGILGVAIPGLILFLTERRRANDPRWKPQLVRVIPAVFESDN